ncbi:uncharacterized protein LOC141904366 [Tubulanus polymorphus]|uniref:uncharacterized protein LOC141904366 n=1 Tax=Tubulanus polymorphus TaxID=672921 RepID=UPI003DA30F01
MTEELKLKKTTSKTIQEEDADSTIKYGDLTRDLDASDSVSQCSSTSSIRLKLLEEEATRRSLETKLLKAKEQQQLQREKLRLELKHKEQLLELDAAAALLQIESELEQSAVRQHVYNEADCDNDGAPRSSKPILSSSQTETKVPPLSAEAREWYPQNVNSRSDMSNMMSCVEQVFSHQQQSNLELTLPKPEMPTFDGNPIDYYPFISAYENLIASKTQNASTRLYMLQQYTKGEANEVVKAFLTNEPNVGLANALDALKRHYGQNYRIATAYIDKVTNGPPIRSEDGASLQKLSVILNSCANVLSQIGYVSKIENPDFMRRLIYRLPYDMRKRWRTKADYITNLEREITISDIASFIEHEARVHTHPIFGDINDSKDKSKQNHPIKKKTFTTNAEEIYSKDSRKNCVYCSENHWLYQCKIFLDKSVEDRRKFAREKALCYNCMKMKHRARTCRSQASCRTCGKRHHSLLHTEQPPPVKNAFVRNPVPGTVKLPIVPVLLKANDCQLTTYALLDSGSTVSFCTESLIDRLKIPAEYKRYQLSTLGRVETVECREISINAYSLDGCSSLQLRNMLSTPSLPVSKNDMVCQDEVNKWPHLDGVTVSNIDSRVELLIGNDNPAALEPIEVRKPANSNGPFAVRTQFGWTVYGTAQPYEVINKGSVNLVKGSDDELNQRFREFCNREFSDAFTDASAMLVDDKKALSAIESTAVMRENHYEVGLPWKYPPSELVNNRVMAEHRLNLLKGRLLKNEELQAKYTKYIDRLLELGFAEQVPVEEVVSPYVWYLPHHPVWHPRKPDKLRVVFDCSAKYQGRSLNDMLYQGPDLTNSLIGVLSRFRQEHVAFIGDIESMFHQVNVEERDRNALRFLWWPDHDIEQPPIDHRMKVHIFGAASSPSVCNYALHRTADDNRADFAADIVETVHRNFYVDDCLRSCRTPEERAPPLRELGDHDLPGDRVLGVWWDMETDTLRFKVNIKPQPVTRRGMLSVVSAIYDPLGLASPLLLPAKVISQHLCKSGLGWDDKVPANYEREWSNWLQDLPLLEEFSVPRCIRPANFGRATSTQLHHFADASEKGFGAVSYVRLINENGHIHSAFLASRSRLAPLKVMSIPRLELSAAVLAVKLDRMLREELDLDIDNSTFWSDSQAVLKYISNTSSRFKVFVANRLSVIQEGSNPEQWRYIPGVLNPADEVSRGLTAQQFLQNDRWVAGPEFLRKQESEWPRQEFGNHDVSIEDTEVKKTFVSKDLEINSSSTSVLLNIADRSSTWHKAKIVAALVMRFIARLKQSVSKRKGLNTAAQGTAYKHITVPELRAAESAIVEAVQRKVYGKEMERLEQNRTTDRRKYRKFVKKTSVLRRLNPIVVNGQLRVGGRLSYSTGNEDQKHPLIHSPNEHVTKLIIRHYHRYRAGHSGRNHVLSLVREKYWIVHGMSAVYRILRDCIDCKKRQGLPGQQMMADLPPERLVADKPPFSNVGIDYFGPYLVKIGRSQVKRYGCIFTCMSSRAVHLEIANSMDTSAFINALRRFIARRGNPECIRSDNGTNFTGAQRELRDSIAGWNQEKIEGFMLQREITWEFNPPSGSHFGGVWERCMRTVRKVLNALLSQQVLNDENLSTLMCEVESVINSRPLTAISGDVSDLQALTPNHILLLRAGGTMPPGVFKPTDMYIKRKWRQVQYLANTFWRRAWVKEYLPVLQERQRWQKPSVNFSVGDIVLVMDHTLPRCCWPLGRVISVHPGKDNKKPTTTYVKNNDKICQEQHKIKLIQE